MAYLPHLFDDPQDEEDALEQTLTFWGEQLPDDCLLAINITNESIDVYLTCADEQPQGGAGPRFSVPGGGLESLSQTLDRLVAMAKEWQCKQ